MRTLRLSDKRRVDVLGVGFDDVTLDGASQLITDHIGTGAGFASVFTPNADTVDRCRRDKTGALRRVFASASLSVPDGIGIVWASRTLGTPLTERVAGIELGERLLALAAENGIPVCFLGGRDGIADEAAKRMRLRLPSLKIAYTHHGFFDKDGDESADVLRLIGESGAKLLFVCFGAPSQEEWIHKNASALEKAGVLCAVGLGGSLDVWSGSVRRAPSFLRSLGLEWLYRSLSRPSRIGRIGSVFSFGCAVMREKRRRRNQTAQDLP